MEERSCPQTPVEVLCVYCHKSLNFCCKSERTESTYLVIDEDSDHSGRRRRLASLSPPDKI